MKKDIDSQIFNQFLHQDIETMSLWEVMNIFEKQRTEFRIEIANYQDEIKQTKEELKQLREQISILKKQKAHLESIIDEKQQSLPDKTPDPKYRVDKLLKLELQNKRLQIEVRDLAQELELEQRDKQNYQHKQNRQDKKAQQILQSLDDLEILNNLSQSNKNTESSVDSRVLENSTNTKEG